MDFQDYKEMVLEDALESIENGDYDYCKDTEDVYEGMWTDDGITGNGSGTYTFSAYDARRNTCELIYDEEFLSRIEWMDVVRMLREGPESMDVTARCLALDEVFYDIAEAWEARMN